MGALFHFLRSGFVCRPYFPVRNPPAVFCRPFRASGRNGISNRGLRSFHSLTPVCKLSPFQGLQIHLCERSYKRRPFSSFTTSYKFTSVSGSNELSPLFLVQ